MSQVRLSQGILTQFPSNLRFKKATKQWTMVISTKQRNRNSQRKSVSGVKVLSGRLLVCLVLLQQHHQYCCGSGETCDFVTTQLSLALWRLVHQSSRSSSGALKKRKVQGSQWLWGVPVSDLEVSSIKVTLFKVPLFQHVNLDQIFSYCR